jgi:hypothetical protein
MKRPGAGFPKWSILSFFKEQAFREGRKMTTFPQQFHLASPPYLCTQMSAHFDLENQALFNWGFQSLDKQVCVGQ